MTARNGSSGSRKDQDDGQGHMPGPKAFWTLPCALSILGWPWWLTLASKLEVSRATHTAQVGQIQSLLSTLSSLSSHHLITGTRPWPAASPTLRMAGHSAAPTALLSSPLLCPASVDSQGYPSHNSRLHRSTVLSCPFRIKPWGFEVLGYPQSGVPVPVHL